MTRHRVIAWQTWQPSQQPLGLWVHDERLTLRELLDSIVKSQLCALVSEGVATRMEVIRELFGNGTKRIEWYGRVMEWQRRWSDDVRVMYHVNHYRWPWLARMRNRSKSAPA